MKHQKDARWPTTPPKYGGLPPTSENSSHLAPPWEIQFCSQIPWTKFCECKKMTFLFENVLNWDDSAGKEAFDNAKSRYWAEINNLQCDIPFPNPDMHIDMVNHDSFLDPRLVEDLYKLPPPPPHKEVPDYNSIEIIPTGWDVEAPATAGSTIPIFISAVDCQSPAHEHVPTTFPTERLHCGNAEIRVHRRDTIDVPVPVVPTGWGDEDDLGSSPACNLSAKQTNGAFYVNTCHISYSGRREVGPKDGVCVKSSYRNSRKDRSWGKGRDFGRRLSSKPTTLRHHEEYNEVNDDSRGCGGRRLNCTGEDYWHYDKGLSCAHGDHKR